MRTLMLTLAVVLAGCSSMQTKWESITPGTPKEELVNTMGQPIGYQQANDGHRIFVWNMGSFVYCGAKIGDDEKVATKGCVTDYDAQARYQQAQSAAAMMYLQMQNSQPRTPAYQPMKAYQAPRPTQSTCQGHWVGSQYYSNCSSTPTGIDTSIYNQ